MIEYSLTPQQVADRYQVSAALIRRHSGVNGRKPQLFGAKFGRLWRYSPAQVDAWVKSLEATGGAE